MFKRILGFAIFLVFFLLSGALSGESSMYYPLLFTLLAVFVLYFYFLDDTISFFLALFLLGVNLVVKISFSSEKNYIWLFSLIFVILLFSFLDYFFWKSKSKLSHEKKSRSSSEIQALKEKFESKEESVKRLERQVSDIAKLFEIAKEFNECLAYDDLMGVVVKKVLKEVSFSKATMVLLDSDSKVSSFYQINGIEGIYEYFDEIVENSEQAQIADYLDKKPYVIRWDTIEDVSQEFVFIQERTEFPFWVFPLFVEEKMIAAFIVENAKCDDYPKYEIVSAQLALQVKKIKLYETVKELSIVDGLTKVFVRRHFLERFSEELKRSMKYDYNLCVLMLDIDHFKTYNDTFGHLVGDMTLKEVSALIKQTVRKVDIIARYGGEEFAIVLPETSKEAGAEVAERIRSRVAKTRFHVYDEDTQVTVSIGVSAYPEDFKDSKEAPGVAQDLMLKLLSHSDQALYKAKEEGRNRVVLFEV